MTFQAKLCLDWLHSKDLIVKVSLVKPLMRGISEKDSEGKKFFVSYDFHIEPQFSCLKERDEKKKIFFPPLTLLKSELA